MILKVVAGVVCLSGLACLAEGLTPEQKGWVAKGKRFERAGWIYLHVEGEARARGGQHGYLLAKEIGEGLSGTKAVWEHDTAMEWDWLAKRAGAMFVPKIDAENLAELDGIAEGAAAAGVKMSREDLIAYNGILELSDYWWPQELKKIKDEPAPKEVRESCSSFVATGSWTKDGNVVLGHNTMQSYVDELPCVIQDIVPAKGHRILWQTQPGWIHSGTDFFITDAGIVGSETTIGNFEGFSTNGVPEFTRMRRATQDAGSLDEWAEIMKRGNNGGYANAWLLGDISSKEIARLELGLKYAGWEKKKDGYFCGIEYRRESEDSETRNRAKRNGYSIIIHSAAPAVEAIDEGVSRQDRRGVRETIRSGSLRYVSRPKTGWRENVVRTF